MSASAGVRDDWARSDPRSDPPSNFFVGVASSRIFGSPAPRRRQHSFASSDEDDFDDDELAALFDTFDDDDDDAAEEAVAPRLSESKGKKRRRRASKMSTGQKVRLLRFLSEEGLSVAALLSALFSEEKPPPYPDSFPPAEHSPHASTPSRKSVTPRFLHHRVLHWLRGTGPGNVARRWKGMDDFAISHVAELVRREIKAATKNPRLQGPPVSKLKTKTLADYSPADAAALAAQLCPSLQKVLDAAIGCEADEEQESHGPALSAPSKSKRRKLQHMPLPLDLLDSSEDEGAQAQRTKKERWGYRGPRNKRNVASALLLMALFGRSSKCKLFQKIMAITLDTARIPKRLLELLSRAGACVSADSVHLIAKSLADDTMRISREILQRPETVVSLSIDNLNWKAIKRDKTATNTNQMMTAVADSPAPSTNVPRPTSTPTPINALGADGRPTSMDRKLREDARLEFLKSEIDPYDFILDEYDTRHLTDCVIAHALRHFLDLHPECEALRDKLPAPPQVFPLVPKRTLVLPLPVYDEDEGSIMGNIQIIDHIIKDFRLSDKWLSEHIVPAVGDAFTATLQRKAIERREDDRSKFPDRDRLDFMQPWAAFFHLMFAYQKYFIDAHAGTSVQMDLLSVRRLSDRAGFSHLTTGTIDYHDADAFMHMYFSAISDVVISAALRQAGHGSGATTEASSGQDADQSAAAEPAEPTGGEDPHQTLTGGEPAGRGGEDPDQTLTGGNEDEAAAEDGVDVAAGAPVREETVAMPVGGKRNTRHPPSEFANVTWEDLRDAATKSLGALLAGDAAAAATLEGNRPSDHIVGHSICLLRDLGVYIELRHAVKHGDPGRVMAGLRQALPRFQARGHHRYVVECLEMMMGIRAELPAALKPVMLAATLINHSGKQDGFLAADLDIEHIVHDLKHVFPVSGKAGGLERQRRIGELLPRDRSLTCKLLASDLEAFAVFEAQPDGRQSPVFEFVKKSKAKHVSSDPVVSSLAALVGTSSKPGSIETYIARKRGSRTAGIPSEVLEEGQAEDSDLSLFFDTEQDMGGFVQLELDID
ncbi:hypothetical protein V8E36_003921 [Tilletia maclaganii]